MNLKCKECNGLYIRLSNERHPKSYVNLNGICGWCRDDIEYYLKSKITQCR